MPQASSELTNQYQRHFSRKLLPHAVQALIMAQFGQPGTIPKNSGTKSIRWFRKDEAKKGTAAAIIALSEGVTPTERRNVNLTAIDADLVQLGQIAEVTDVVGMTALFHMLNEHVSTMGEDCALDADHRTTLAVVPSITAAGQRRFSQGLANFAALTGATAANGKFVRADGLKAVTQLKINRARKIGGSYVCAIDPRIGQDLQQDDDWKEADKYAGSKKLFNGELGSLDGVRYVEHTQPFIEDDTLNTYDETGGIFTTLFLGAGAYGVPKLTGTASPFKPSVTILDKADKSDPHNQRLVAAWKAYWVAKLLNEKYAVTMRSKSTFG